MSLIKPTWLKKGFDSNKLTLSSLSDLIIKDQKTCKLKNELNIQQYKVIWTRIVVGKYFNEDQSKLISYFTGLVKVNICINNTMIQIYFENGKVKKTPNYTRISLDIED
jgi:hypothetical protein